jgi:hypothetical protein
MRTFIQSWWYFRPSLGLGEGGGMHALPPFHFPSIRVTSPLSAPSPAKLAREYCLYGHKWPISLFSLSRTFCFLQQKKHGSISCSENDAGLVINGTGERKKWKTKNWIRKKKIIRKWRWRKRWRRVGRSRNTSKRLKSTWKCRPENVEQAEGKWNRKRKQRWNSWTAFLVEVSGHI